MGYSPNKLVFRTSYGQRRTLLQLRYIFGEQGYIISSVAELYRLTDHDFLAAPKGNPHELLLVQPSNTKKDQLIRIRRYIAEGYVEPKLLAAIKQRRPVYCEVVVWDEPLRAPRGDDFGGWQWYYPKPDRRQIIRRAELGR